MALFEELRLAERILLIRAFDYNVDAEGFILDSSGSRIPSDEDPDRELTIDGAMIISGAGGTLDVLDGTPTSISKFLRKVEEAESIASDKKETCPDCGSYLEPMIIPFGNNLELKTRKCIKCGWLDPGSKRSSKSDRTRRYRDE